MEFPGYKPQRGSTLQGPASNDCTLTRRGVAELLIQEGFLALDKGAIENAIALFEKAREQMLEGDFIRFCIYISEILKDRRLESPAGVSRQHRSCRDQCDREAEENFETECGVFSSVKESEELNAVFCNSSLNTKHEKCTITNCSNCSGVRNPSVSHVFFGNAHLPGSCHNGKSSSHTTVGEVIKDTCSQPILTDCKSSRYNKEDLATFQMGQKREHSKDYSAECRSSEVTNVNSGNVGKLNMAFSDGRSGLPKVDHRKTGEYSMNGKDLAPSVRIYDIHGGIDVNSNTKGNRKVQTSKQETVKPRKESNDKGRNVKQKELRDNAVHKDTEKMSKSVAEDIDRRIKSEEDNVSKEDSAISRHSEPMTECKVPYKESYFFRTGRECSVVGVKVLKIGISFLFLVVAILIWFLSLIFTIVLTALRISGVFLIKRVIHMLKSLATYRWHTADKDPLRSSPPFGSLPKSPEEAVRYLLKSQKCEPLRILGVSDDANPEDIKSKYRRLAMLVHPDKCNVKGANEAFVILKTAFDALMNPNSNPQYERAYNAATNASDCGRDKCSTPLLCNACGNIHRMTLVNRTQLSARYCSCCGTYIYARNGEVWVEGWFKFAFSCYTCVNGKIYDVTDWGRCNGFLDLPPNTHHAAGSCSFASNTAEQKFDRRKASSSWDHRHSNRDFPRGPAAFVGKVRRSCKRRKGGGSKSKD